MGTLGGNGLVLLLVVVVWWLLFGGCCVWWLLFGGVVVWWLLFGDARDAHLCNLGEIQLQGTEMEVLLGTYLQCEARLRTSDMRAVKSVCHQSTKDIH